MANLQDLINAKLQSSGLSPSQAAKEAGISYVPFKKLLEGKTGQRAPQKRVINALAEWLDQNPSFLEMVAKGKATAPTPPEGAAGDGDLPGADPRAVQAPIPAPARPEAPPKSEAEIAERRGEQAPVSDGDGVLPVPLVDLLAAARGERSVRVERDGVTYVLSGERALIDFATGRL